MLISRNDLDRLCAYSDFSSIRPMNEFSHLNESGQANMVDVSAKNETERLAVAQAKVVLSPEVMHKIRQQSIAKGDLLATARIAGIQAAKQCSQLIPLCHPLPLSKVTIDIEEFSEPEPSKKGGLKITAACKTVGKTGVEMEALTGASIAALTIYDMCKALDKSIVIESIKLLSKQGGKSGDWERKGDWEWLKYCFLHN